MSRNIILGALGNIGFDLCMLLLENGEQVCHLNVSDEYESDEAIEEKLLFVGRNSNFSNFNDISNFLNEISNDNNKPSTIIIPLLDWIHFHSDKIKIVFQKVMDFLNSIEKNSVQYELLIIQPDAYKFNEQFKQKLMDFELKRTIFVHVEKLQSRENNNETNNELNNMKYIFEEFFSQLDKLPNEGKYHFIVQKNGINKRDTDSAHIPTNNSEK